MKDPEAMCLNQRGAMFGLDARIALAIFGGLTIITGAALFKAIGQTIATAQLVELENVNKAVMQYMLDTGGSLPSSSILQNLIVDYGVVGWKGPYLSVESSAANSYLNVRGYIVLPGLPRSDSPWSATLTDVPTTCVAVDPTCHYFAVFGLSGALGGDLVPLDVHESLDEMVDGGDGYETGNYRMREQAGSRYVGYLKGPQRLR